ncbi:peptidase inhibitor family I36 protein [Streptomyces albipurpureus]|uniref:Peptidase inhibitor family I36 protein n=1 Tax=Streptomyces albipurpureus TaxID=2897419 RepID=A0ABT0UQJ1_9ACTN|nr:peptidase inhibitor family I36 protein [Streptomyces sp. CWNU-1]MCM2390632.1 peptidase inhibitor family I36 protein [Streptomyces sp. CWNU-1]
MNPTFSKIAVLATTLLSFSMISEASALESQADPLQTQINAVLATTQGGTQISPNEISWNSGSVIMSFPAPGETQAPASSPAARKLESATSAVGTGASTTNSEDPGTDPDPAGPGSEPAGPEVADNCPTQVIGNDWYCFYQYTNFGGRRLQFKDAHSHETPVFFSDYGFENKTSSWSNKGGKNIYVYNRSVTGSDWSCRPDQGGHWLWTENDHTRSSNVGTTNDNKADCFYTS